MMKTQTVNGFEWIDGARFTDEDGEPDETNEPCAAECGRPVLTGQRFRVCAENGEMVHAECKIPAWS